MGLGSYHAAQRRHREHAKLRVQSEDEADAPEDAAASREVLMRMAILTAENGNHLAVNPRSIKLIVFNPDMPADELAVGIEFLGEAEEIAIKQSFEAAVQEINEALNYERVDLAGDKRRSGLAAARFESDSTSGFGSESVSSL
jgi:hypothetical protein